MAYEFQAVWEHANNLFVKQTSNLNTVESSERDQDTVQLPILAFFNEVFPALRSWFYQVRKLAQCLPR